MTGDTPSLLDRSPVKLNEVVLLAAIVAVFLLTAAADPNHTYFSRFQASAVIILRNTALLGIIALGSAVVIIAGGIDLSAGSMVAFSATVCALTMVLCSDPSQKSLANVGVLGVTCGIGAGVLSGLLVGSLHTWLITAIRLPPFIATLATLVGLRSLARTQVHWGTASNQVYINNPVFKVIKENWWISLVVFAVLAAITWLILTRTVLGRHVFALGGNEQAAKLSGVQTDNVKWFAYCFGALTAAIAGIFEMADTTTAQPVQQARGYELNAIAAAVVGGCSLQGGVGTVTGTVLGALFLRVVIDAVSKLIKAGADVYEGMIVGIVVALAVTLTQLRQLMATGREFFPGLRGWFAIATLAIFAAMLAMMASANIEFLKGYNVWFGVGLGSVLLAVMIAVKIIEMRAEAAAGQSE
jgi:ribose/xylose/arabinose/galactoside ABC-type transport system permease subunit